MRLILHSQQDSGQTVQNDAKLIRSLTGKGAPRIGFIPSTTDKRRKAFAEKQNYYKAAGLGESFFYDAEETQDNDTARGIFFALDAIHLGSGQAIPFLERLRSTDSVTPLLQFVERGGLLIGESAGAMLAGSSLKISTFFGERQIADCNGLGLVDFEILPHWNAMRVSPRDVERFVKQEHSRVLVLNDGDCVVVNGKKMRYLDSRGREIKPTFFSLK